MIPLSRPSYILFKEAVKKSVCDVIDSEHIAQGQKVAEFEQLIAEYTNKKHTIAVSSGTAGLFLCLKALGIGEGDEVITTPFSFVASTNVILHCGAKVVFVDIDRDTYNIDIDKANKAISARTKTILPVDVFGNPVDTNKLTRNATILGYNPLKSEITEGDLPLIPIVLDTCESLGSKMDRPFDCAVYAFYPNKQITTVEGGVIITDNDKIAEYCRMARNQGRADNDKWLQHGILGYNFRMSDVHAAIGVEQMRRIGGIIAKRQEVLYQYEKRLNDVVKLQSRTVFIDDFSPFVFTVQVDNRDKVMQYLLENGVECKPYFPAITDMPYMKDLGYKTSDYPICQEVSSRTLALPFYTDMAVNEVETVCKALIEALNLFKEV